MKIHLQKVTLNERQTLWNLLQYSLFEESATDDNSISPDGTFSYKYFDKYFTDADRIAFLVRDDQDGLLGFVMINQYLQKSSSGHAIAEFMILPRFRRQGIGRIVARRLFEMFPGNWEVQPAIGSETAYKFWKTIIDEVTKKDNQAVDGIFVFHTSATDDNYEPLSEGIRSYGEDERVSPATAGADDAPRRKMVNNYHEEGVT